MSALAYWVLHMKHVKPLTVDAPVDCFSETRALNHVRQLAQVIGGRQEGSPGLHEAARYIKAQMEMLQNQAGPDFRVEVDETFVNGSFNMEILGRSISLGYRNHTNLLLRISSADSKDSDPSVLVNGHFDSPLGSPGAGDCASCVASMLELARLIVESGWVPPRPIIFLFNGAEEVFLLGSHGFATTHKWYNSIGAFINIEASGTGGLDLVCQSGRGSWPSFMYAKSAVYPMAHSSAQDVFPIIPGDTDYRIFSEDYGDIPGLDIIFVFGGYFYHTSYDTIERLLPGSLQARGENLLNLIKGFANSSELQNAQQRASAGDVRNGSKNDRAVFFDYLTWFMIFYTRKEALVLHSLPMVVLLLVPFFLNFSNVGVSSWFGMFLEMIKGLLLHTFAILLAVIIPVVFSIFRLLISSNTMNWFAHPSLAFLMFVPCSFAGLLIPRIIWGNSPMLDGASLKESREDLLDGRHHWGAFGFYSSLSMVYLYAGLGGGFMTFFVSVCMILSWCFYGLFSYLFGQKSLRAVVGYIVPLVPPLTFNVYFGGFLVQFLVEKMGMMGSLPNPYGFFIPDIIIASAIGIVTGWCVGPIVPIVGHWLARSNIVQFMLHISVAMMAISSQFFPYSTSAPKRLVLQHTFQTSDASQILDSSYEFSVVDANSLYFVFKNAPEAAKELQIHSDFSLDNTAHSEQSNWMVLLPVSYLFSGSLKFPAREQDIINHYKQLPKLSMNKPIVTSNGPRRVYLELNLGSLKEVWGAVLNITGPLSNWSFADNKLPAPEKFKAGPLSYICRLSGSSSENWSFWLEANSSEALRVDLGVLDQYLVEKTRKLKGHFPAWMDVIAYSSFLSSYTY
ncbi:hypothetical protein AMTR_s00013p00220950 [Amborella trichopoda]|uniref:Uncharacterized protein n=2 Tax=Amborella trichopoda TaxID=13333 RepID=W1PRU5_AMBTC|nr:hypothetical protein AMTR_s00013p00220950 [Amborella trichopoda]